MLLSAVVSTRRSGCALRKRFCATFDFELQAAANDDAFVLSLGPQHSFPLDSAPRMLASKTAPATLTQAVLASPMFTSRWRWNLNRSLAILRFRGGRKNPLPIQRMEADDLMAAVFPSLAACQENAPAGPIVIPDHVLVRQTLYDCLHEAMDVDGLVQVVEGFESGSIRTHFVDSPEPSVLSHEILNGKPYTFLDDAPLEERRTRAVQLRRGLPVQAGDLGKLDEVGDCKSPSRSSTGRPRCRGTARPAALFGDLPSQARVGRLVHASCVDQAAGAWPCTWKTMRAATELWCARRKAPHGSRQCTATQRSILTLPTPETTSPRRSGRGELRYRLSTGTSRRARSGDRANSWPIRLA